MHKLKCKKSKHAYNVYAYKMSEFGLDQNIKDMLERQSWSIFSQKKSDPYS